MVFHLNMTSTLPHPFACYFHVICLRSIPLRCSISLSIFISSPPYSSSASLPHQCSSAFLCVTLASCHLISSFFLLHPARCSSLSLSRLFFFLSLSCTSFFPLSYADHRIISKMPGIFLTV